MLQSYIHVRRDRHQVTIEVDRPEPGQLSDYAESTMMRATLEAALARLAPIDPAKFQRPYDFMAGDDFTIVIRATTSDMRRRQIERDATPISESPLQPHPDGAIRYA